MAKVRVPSCPRTSCWRSWSPPPTSRARRNARDRPVQSSTDHREEGLLPTVLPLLRPLASPSPSLPGDRSLASSRWTVVELGVRSRSIPSACAASSQRPWLASHLGDSGRYAKPTICRALGSAPRPSIHRQPPGTSAKRPASTHATNWPTGIVSAFAVTIRPRSAGRHASATYIGTLAVDRPMAMPRTARPTRRQAMPPRRSVCAEGAAAMTRAPAVNTTDAKWITGRRP